MASCSSGKWKLVAAVFVALGTTAAISALVATWWASDDGPASIVFQEPSPEPSDAAEHSVYDLPDHSGQMVADLDGDRVGLPKLSADYEIDVRGDLATVVVRQSFKNPKDMTIEPVYEFPLYAEAAVYAMTMEIGDRRIEAEIKRKEEARKEYEEAKRQGKKAALLDQDRPNLFTQRVANLEPGQTVEITLRYTHPLPKDRGVYQLAVPLAVAAGFAPSDMSGNKLVEEDGPEDPGATPGGVDGKARDASGPDEVSLSVRIDGGMAISQLESPSHRIRVETFSETVRRVELADTNDPTARHFRLGFRLAGDEPQVGVSSYWNDEREQGTFSMLVEPPAEVAAEDVPNREMIFVIDKSGSMNEERMELANAFVSKTLDHLRPDDHFRIIYFSNDVTQYAAEPILALPENVDTAKRFVKSVTSRGGTMMAPALEAALEPAQVPETLRMVMVVTDVSVRNEFEIIKTIREHIGDARLFAVGVGGNVNRYLLTEIGRAGRGFSTQFEADENAQRVIDDAVRRLQKPVLTDISVDWGSLEVEEVSPNSLPDVFEGGSVRLHGRYKNPGRHRITVHGKLRGEPVSYETKVEFADSTNDGKAVELAWARQRIQDYMHSMLTPKKLREDELDDEVLKGRIIRLGLDYSLTTQWTSLVAIGELPAGESAEAEPEAAVGGDLGIINRARKSRVRKRRVRRKKSDKIQILRGSSHGGGADSSGVRTLGKRVSEADVAAPSKEEKAAATKKRKTKGEKPSPAVDLNVDAVAGEGTLDREIIARVLRAHRRELLNCYEKELEKDAGLKGDLSIGFRINLTGDVGAVHSKKSTVGSAAVENCALEKVKRWTFLKPKNNKLVLVTFTAKFTTSN